MKSMCYAFVLMMCLACSATAPDTGEDSTMKATPVNNITAPASTQAKITARVEGLSTADGEAYLVGMFTGQQYPLDTAQIDANGTMVFENSDPYQQGYAFIWLPTKTAVQLMLAEDQEFNIFTKVSTIVEDMKVEGSIDNKLFYQNLQFERTLQPQFNDLSQKMKGIADKNSTAYLELKKQNDALVDQRQAHLQQIFDTYPNSFYTKFKSAGQNPEAKDVRKADGTVDNRPTSLSL